MPWPPCRPRPSVICLSWRVCAKRRRHASRVTPKTSLPPRPAIQPAGGACPRGSPCARQTYPVLIVFDHYGSRMHHHRLTKAHHTNVWDKPVQSIADLQSLIANLAINTPEKRVLNHKRMTCTTFKWYFLKCMFIIIIILIRN